MDERTQIDANELSASEKEIQAAKAARAEGAGQFAGGVGAGVDAYVAGGGNIAKGMEKLNTTT
jgi:hypothetical protein